MIRQPVALSLGSNQGDRSVNLQAMVDGLQEILLPPVACSRLMETAPLEVSGEQEWYFNRVMNGWFGAGADALLQKCQDIERNLGRRRPYPRAPRTADIDILLFGDVISDNPALRLPHPGVLTRRFCLEGLLDVAPLLIIPGTGRTIQAHHAGMTGEIRRQEIRFQK